MRLLFRAYQFLNILSIDIVAGALTSALFFAKILEVRIRPMGLVALALTVWAIYTTDHLRDAKKIARPAATLRHRFHQKNFRVLSLCLCAAIATGAVVIFFIRRQVFESGLILTGAVILYLGFQRYLRFLKEFFVACLYTAGVVLLSITVTPLDITLAHILLIIQFAIAAWTNLILFSWFDFSFDEKNDQNSFVTIFGKKTARTFLVSLFGFSLLLSILQMQMSTPLVPVLILLLMNITLLLTFVFRKALGKQDLYRLIGDAVFLFPSILLAS
jgi:4-hydroxybenzoate polyprenyltransferase